MPRSPLLRLLLLVAGAFGATLLWQGVAAATSPPALGVETPVVPVTVELPDVPLVAEITDSIESQALAGSTLPVPMPVEVPSLDAVTDSLSVSTPADAPTATTGSADAGTTPTVTTTAPVPAAHAATGAHVTRTDVVATLTVPASSIETGDAPAPILPARPWTISFVGVAAVLACVGADANRTPRGDRSPFAGLVVTVRHTVTRWLDGLGPARPDPAHAGFALLLARPG